MRIRATTCSCCGKELKGECFAHTHAHARTHTHTHFFFVYVYIFFVHFYVTASRQRGVRLARSRFFLFLLTYADVF
jgi:predicted amidophosphoribosyltransferase